MAGKSQVSVLIVGDSSGAQKALKEVQAAVAQTEQQVARSAPHIEEFGKTFAKMAAGIGAVALVKQGVDAIADYSKTVQEAETNIHALTQSNAAVAEAQRIANREFAAGRAAYSETLKNLADLTPLSNQTGQSLDTLYQTAMQLATLNSGPEGGVSGAIVAIGNALTGDWTSATDRFNLPRQLINKLKAEGVPDLEIFRQALAASGVTMGTVTEQAKTASNQQKLLTDSIAKLGAEAGGNKGLDLWTTALIGLNKVAQSGAVKEFAAGLRELLGVAISGQGFAELSVDVRKSIYLILYAFNDMLEGLSGGRVSVAKNLQAMRDAITADEGKLRQTIAEKVGKPVKDGTDEAYKPTTQQKAAVTGYGAEILAAYLKGLKDPAQFDTASAITNAFAGLFKGTDGKQDADRLAEAQATVAQALQEVARDGHMSNDTMLMLSHSFGLQTTEVGKLITAYGQMTAAQRQVTTATVAVAGAQAALNDLTVRSQGDLAQYQQGVADAQAAAKAHTDATTEALGAEQDALKANQKEAAAAAKASAQATKDLQAQADAHSAAYAAQEAAAQAQAEAATTRRTQLQGLLDAALKGTTEEYLRQNDITDESIRKIGEKWQAEIDGARRAKDGANAEVTKLQREANLDERNSLHQIADLRAKGETAAANAAQKALDQRKKQRAAQMELARADAAVANDEYDAKAEQLQKQGAAQDEQESRAEKDARAQVTRIQSAAAAQKAADDAALRAQQEAATAEQERYQAQQQGIQDEIDKIQDAAAAQKKKDDAAVVAAQKAYDDRKAYWDQELTQGGQAVTQAQNRETSAKNIADASKTAYDNLVKISQLTFDNLQKAADNVQTIANTPAPVIANPAGVMPNGGVSPYDETPPSPPQQYTPHGNVNGGAPALPLIDAATSAYPPIRYHRETEQGGKAWYVPDGFTLGDYGKTQAASQSNSGGDSTSLGRGQASLALGPTVARQGLGGAATADTAGVSLGDVHIHLPNVTSLDDPKQLKAIGRQIRGDLAREMAQAWDEAVRSGPPSRNRLRM